MHENRVSSVRCPFIEALYRRYLKSQKSLSKFALQHILRKWNQQTDLLSPVQKSSAIRDWLYLFRRMKRSPATEKGSLQILSYLLLAQLDHFH